MTKSECREKEMEQEFDFEKDLSINKFRLDEECLSHSSLYFKYAEAQQKAKSEVSKAEDNLNLTLATMVCQVVQWILQTTIKTTFLSKKTLRICLQKY